MTTDSRPSSNGANRRTNESAFAIPLPKVPMSPIVSPNIPEGPEWVYQLKWDGVRTLARLDGHGGVELFSKRMERKNDVFPEIVELLEPLRTGSCLMDGEIVYFDGKKPNFQRGMLTGKTRYAKENLMYILFDLLYDGGEDLRTQPFMERFTRLTAKFPDKLPRLYVTELFHDGNALWNWVIEKDWEGIVSKRTNSQYAEGKHHKDWFKKRKELRLVANVVGLKRNSGQIASLVLSYEGRYIGHVSGLDYSSKTLLSQFAQANPGSSPFDKLTPGMLKSDVLWLAVPFPCRISALEFTDSGLLRQPKLLGFGAAEEAPAIED